MPAMSQSLSYCQRYISEQNRRKSQSYAFILAGGEVERQYTIKIIRSKLYGMLESVTSLQCFFCMILPSAVFTEKCLSMDIAGNL